MIFWIDQNNFSNQLLEKVFKKAGMTLYTLGSVKDFSYLVSDLKPLVIVLDFLTFEQDKDLFFQQLEDIKNIPFIIIGNGDVPGINIIARIHRPFDAFDLPDKISNIIKFQ